MKEYTSYQNQYADILRKLLDKPQKKVESRVGDVRSRFVETIRVDLEKEFPLMEIKHVSFKNILVELLWFISGKTNIKFLVDNGCNIWNDDAYRYYKEKYSPFRFDDRTKEDKQLSLDIDRELTKKEFIEKVKKGELLHERFLINTQNGVKFLHDNYAWLDTTYRYGDLDKVYGFQWRNFNGSSDQLLSVIQTLKTNPDDRRMIVTAHNPTDLESGNVGLPSCHNYFQFYTVPLTATERTRFFDEDELTFETDKEVHKIADERGYPKYKLSIYYNIRSNDFFLGQPYNTPSYALLLKMVANIVNMIPSEVVCNAVDCHLYEAHVDSAKEWLERYNKISDESTYCKSKVNFTRNPIESIDNYTLNDFELVDYNSLEPIKAPLLT